MDSTFRVIHIDLKPHQLQLLKISQYDQFTDFNSVLH